MPAHHLGQGRKVRRAARRCGQDLADLAEVGGPEDAGRRDREELRVYVAAVLERVDRSLGTQTASPGPISTESPSMVQVLVPCSP